MRALRIIRVASIAAGLMTWADTASAQGAYKVVVHSSNSVGSLTKHQLSLLFLKRTTSWANGSAVAPVDQGDRSRVREAFSVDVLDKPAAAVKRFWQKEIFSGREVPPPTEQSDAQVLEFVRSHKGAIGYVSSEESAEGVRVVKISP